MRLSHGRYQERPEGTGAGMMMVVRRFGKVVSAAVVAVVVAVVDVHQVLREDDFADVGVALTAPVKN